MQVVYHGNGVTWDEAWGMSAHDRNNIIKYINQIREEEEAQITGKRKM